MLISYGGLVIYAFFKRISFLLEVVAGLVSNISSEFKSEHKIPKQRKPIMPPLIEGVPWGYFNGASQGHPMHCGVRGCLVYFRISPIQG
jgi:hypothetical protein